MIYDCFPFFNEFDILQIRLEELYNTADKFVIVEATKTHSNKPKPLYFQENKERFAKYADKIIHYVASDLPDGENAWSREIWQRDCIARVISPNKEDTVIISDADEVPRAETVKKYSNLLGLCILHMDNYYYYLNGFYPMFWPHPKIMNGSNFLSNTPSQLRAQSTTDNSLTNGGWHFSYMGGADGIVTKLESYAHQEFNLDRLKDKQWIESHMDAGMDVLDRGIRILYQPIDASFPKFVVDNQETLIRQGLIKSNHETPPGIIVASSSP